MKGSIYTIFYSAVLAVVCALLLTSANAFTRPHIEANKAAERMRNILEVLEVPGVEKAGSKELTQIYEEKVSEKQYGTLNVYETADGAVAVPFAGPGLWGQVKGFLALESDKKTILGVTFYEQEETPGLGGEIGAQWFRVQFRGKSLRGKDGKPGILIVRDGNAAPNGVDAIRGATMTCDKVQAMLNEVIGTIVKELGHDVQ